mgnify:CR=1 FL=1
MVAIIFSSLSRKSKKFVPPFPRTLEKTMALSEVSLSLAYFLYASVCFVHSKFNPDDKHIGLPDVCATLLVCLHRT